MTGKQAQEYAALLADVGGKVREAATLQVELSRKAQVHAEVERRLRMALETLAAKLSADPLERQLAATVAMGRAQALIAEALGWLSRPSVGRVIDLGTRVKPGQECGVCGRGLNAVGACAQPGCRGRP